MRDVTIVRETLPPIDISRALVNPSEEDAGVLQGLAEVAQVGNPDLLQAALDRATWGPNRTANLIRDEEREPSGEVSFLVLTALRAALAATKSNIVFRLASNREMITEEARTALETDEIYLERRRRSWMTPDRDVFKKWGSAMLWGLAQYAAGQPVSRDTDGRIRVPRRAAEPEGVA